jgi:AraC-like DNA-binding protein
MPRKTIHHFWRSPALPFVESRCANDSAACYAPHAHATLSLGAVDDGQSVFSQGVHRQRLTRGDVVLIPAGEVHSCNPEKDGRWSYQMLYLDEDWVRGVVGEMGALDAVVLNRLPARVAPRRIHERLTRLNACLFGEQSVEDKEAAVLLFVGELFGQAQTKALHRLPRPEIAELQHRLHDVQATIAVRCTETLALEELAAVAGMSRYHFVRAFSRAVGMTPHAWQIDLRIRRARRLLDQGVPLADAALQLGFADQSHFQRAFKQRVAATPGEYRRTSAPAAISFNTQA